ICLALDLHSFPTRRSSDLIVGTITGFTLTLDVTGGKDNTGSFLGLPKESWQVYGSTDSSTDSSTRATFGTLTNSSQWVFSVTSRSEEHTSELQSRENLVCR